MLKHWLLAIRPKTLSIAVAPVLVGSVQGGADSGMLVWPVMLVAMLAALLIQVGTNLHNDAADFAHGADISTTRIGPPRATAQGWLTVAQVRHGATLSFSLAMVMGSYLVWKGGWPILTVGLFSIVAGWSYTGGPKPIAYVGLGELFVFIFFGLVAVAGSYYLQTAALDWPALITGAMLGMPAAAVLVVNNYRDLENDRQAGKNTVAVRLGRTGSKVEYSVLMLTPFTLLPLMFTYHNYHVVLMLPCITIPWALYLVCRFLIEAPGPAFNRLLATTAQFQLGFGLLLCLAMLDNQRFTFSP
jgi:1,4-dihydroxy-2-naphthoate polyprenyltransferase